MINTLKTICKKINYDHKTYQIQYNHREDFILSAHCCSYIIKWDPKTSQILKEYYPNQLSSFTAFRFVKHRKLILVVVPNKIVLLDYNLKEKNNYSLESNQTRFQNNFRISKIRLYIQAENKIYIFSLNNLRLLKIHDPFQIDSEIDNYSQNNDQNYRQVSQNGQQFFDKILFDIYGDTLVSYTGKQFEILPDQICQENEHYEAEIERIIRNINNNKVFNKEISSFFFFSQSQLLILSTPTKTFFINLNDYSFFYVKTGNCMKVIKNHQKNIFYWTSENNEHFVTHLDFKITQIFNQSNLRVFNISFVIDNNQKKSYLLNNESLKQLKCTQIDNRLQPYQVFSNPQQYFIHDRLGFIKTCFFKQLLSKCQFVQLYETNYITADQLLFYNLLIQQQQSLEVANLI